MNYVFLIIQAVIIILICANFYADRNQFYGYNPLVFIILKPLMMVFFSLHLWINKIKIPMLVAVYIIGCWLGDITLLFRGFFYLILGGTFFSVAHGAMVLYFKVDYKRITPQLLIISAPIVFMFIFILIPHILKQKTKYSMAISYVFVLVGTSMASAQRYLQYGFSNPKFYVIHIGYLFFMVSDYILLKYETAENSDGVNFEILSTYGIAQMFISSGIVLCERKIKN